MISIEPLFVVLIAFAQAGFVSFCANEFARTSGPVGLKQSTFLAMAVSIVLSYVFVPHAQMILGVVMFAALTGAASFWNTARIEKSIRHQIEMAPKVVKFTQAYFRSLHVDGVITSVTLWDMMDGAKDLTVLEAEKYEMFNHLILHMQDIGHVVSTQYVSGGGMHGGTVVSTYGISVSDLNTYEARLKEKYSRWY